MEFTTNTGDERDFHTSVDGSFATVDLCECDDNTYTQEKYTRIGNTIALLLLKRGKIRKGRYATLKENNWRSDNV